MKSFQKIRDNFKAILLRETETGNLIISMAVATPLPCIFNFDISLKLNIVIDYWCYKVGAQWDEPISKIEDKQF